MIHALAEHLRAPGARLPGLTAEVPLHFLKLGLEEYPGESTPLLLLAFAARARHPVAVAKIARAASGDALLGREAAMLSRARQLLPAELASRVPRLLQHGELNGRSFVLMAALPGEVEMHHTWGARRAHMCHGRMHAALQWALDAASAAPAPAIDTAAWLGPEAIDAMWNDARVLGCDASMRHRLEERLGATWSTPWPAGLAHGDYFPGNLLFHRRALTGVVDWALAVERAPIFYDVLTYEFSFAIDAARRGAVPPAREWRAVHALAPIAAARRRLAALGVSVVPGGAARLATLLALHRSARQCGRQRMCEVFVRLLAAELEISPGAAGE